MIFLVKLVDEGCFPFGTNQLTSIPNVTYAGSFRRYNQDNHSQLTPSPIFLMNSTQNLVLCIPEASLETQVPE